MSGNTIKTTLLHGAKELSKSFMFEIAIYWAEQGHRVFYITPVQWTCFPSSSHETNNPAPIVFKLMKFLYLSNYEALVTHLVEFHTLATLPSVLIIDDLDNYIEDNTIKEERDLHIAKTCALILDTMVSCSRILKTNVHLCVWSSTLLTKNSFYYTYFQNVWQVTTNEKNENQTISLSKISSKRSLTDGYFQFDYHQLFDGSRVLKTIFYQPSTL